MTVTRNFGFDLIEFDALPWHVRQHNNLHLLDAVLARFITVSNLKGAWENATAVGMGDKYVDVADDTIWQVVTAHTTASTGTFVTDRTNNPTFWTSVTVDASFGGAWAASTAYTADTFVIDGSIYGVTKRAYTSGESYADDVANGDIETLIDLTNDVTSAAASAASAAASAAAAAADAASALSALASTEWEVDLFSGDTVETNFTLTSDPGNEKNVFVFVDETYIPKDEFTVVGTTLNIPSAPGNGTNNIEIVYNRALPVGAPSDNTVTTIKIVNLAVTTAKIANNAVTAAKIASGIITNAMLDAGFLIDTADLAASAVETTQLADLSVSTSKLQALAVTAAKIAANTITAAKIAPNTITAAEIAANAIGTSELADNAVDTGAIADNAVDGAKIAMGSDAQGDILHFDGTDYVRLGPGTAGQRLQTAGAGADPAWATPDAVDAQVFTASGTWTKPAVGTIAILEAWGAGGSGGASASGGDGGGGGGGGYAKRVMLLSAMGATETITIGAGGAGVTATNHGNAGGSTTIGSLLTAFGGGGGAGAPNAGGGGGAGALGAGGDSTGSSQGSQGQLGGGGGTDIAKGLYGGGGGGKGTGSPTVGGAAYGGGGGGGAASVATQTVGGSSALGGAGSDGNKTGNSDAGTQPGGGSGGSFDNTSGAGGDGQVNITVI